MQDQTQQNLNTQKKPINVTSEFFNGRGLDKQNDDVKKGVYENFLKEGNTISYSDGSVLDYNGFKNPEQWLKNTIIQKDPNSAINNPYLQNLLSPDNKNNIDLSDKVDNNGIGHQYLGNTYNTNYKPYEGNFDYNFKEAGVDSYNNLKENLNKDLENIKNSPDIGSKITGALNGLASFIHNGLGVVLSPAGEIIQKTPGLREAGNIVAGATDLAKEGLAIGGNQLTKGLEKTGLPFSEVPRENIKEDLGRYLDLILDLVGGKSVGKVPNVLNKTGAIDLLNDTGIPQVGKNIVNKTKNTIAETGIDLQKSGENNIRRADTLKKQNIQKQIQELFTPETTKAEGGIGKTKLVNDLLQKNINLDDTRQSPLKLENGILEKKLKYKLSEEELQNIERVKKYIPEILNEKNINLSKVENINRVRENLITKREQIIPDLEKRLEEISLDKEIPNFNLKKILNDVKQNVGKRVGENNLGENYNKFINSFVAQKGYKIKNISDFFKEYRDFLNKNNNAGFDAPQISPNTKNVFRQEVGNTLQKYLDQTKYNNIIDPTNTIKGVNKNNQIPVDIKGKLIDTNILDNHIDMLASKVEAKRQSKLKKALDTISNISSGKQRISSAAYITGVAGVGITTGAILSAGAPFLITTTIAGIGTLGIRQLLKNPNTKIGALKLLGKAKRESGILLQKANKDLIQAKKDNNTEEIKKIETNIENIKKSDEIIRQLPAPEKRLLLEAGDKTKVSGITPILQKSRSQLESERKDLLGKQTPRSNQKELDKRLTESIRRRKISQSRQKQIKKEKDFENEPYIDEKDLKIIR